MGRRQKLVLRLTVLVVVATALAFIGGSARSGVDAPSVTAAGATTGGDENTCIGGTKAGSGTFSGTLIQKCTITARQGSCIQRSNDPQVRQVCTFTQQPGSSGAPKENKATAIQIVEAHGQQGTLDATQKIVVLQRNTTKNNVFGGAQTIVHCLVAGGDNGHGITGNGDAGNGNNGDCENGHNGNGPPPGTIEQIEESQQSIDVCQGGPATTASTGPGTCDEPGGMLANNTSLAWQKTDLTEIAAGALVEIVQFQNEQDRTNECTIETPGFDDELSDTCYTVRQNTDGTRAKNLSQLKQDYNVFQRAKNTLAGEQVQGRPGRGGLEHVFVQDSAAQPANSKQVSDTDKRWDQIRLNTGALTWQQHDRHSKGTGIQEGSAASRAFMDQVTIQNTVGSPSLGEQTAVLVIFCDSSGNCTGRQRAVVNGVAETNFQSGSVITMAIVCGDVGVFPEVPSSVLAGGPSFPGPCTPETAGFDPPYGGLTRAAY
jgi:hypothetical protein